MFVYSVSIGTQCLLDVTLKKTNSQIMVFYKNTGFGYKDTRFWSFRKDNLHNNFAGCLTFYVCITVKNNVPAHSSLIRWPECEKCFSCYGTSLHLKDPVDIVQKSMRISMVLLSATQSKIIEAELTLKILKPN